MRISGSKIMATKITGDALESYLKCKTKAHLKLAGHQGSMSDYEGLLVASRQEVRRQAIAKILAQHPETEVARDIPLTAAALRAGPSFVLDTTLEDDLLTLRFAGLKRVDGSSKLGDFHYVPMLFHEGRKVGKEQRLLLELHGLILSQIQGRLPANGVVWHGRECKATRVRLNPDKRRAERFLQEVREMGSAESPTRLILNEHCQVCEFRQRCHDQAVQEDNISLIRGMSERSIRKYQKKGITTLSQLSCTFRPRKNNKREVKNRRPHSFGLQALAVRDGRIYVYGTPDLPTSPVRIYLDVEGDPDRNFVYLIGLVIDEGGAERRHSFWADDEAGEERIFREFLDVVGSYEDFSLFFYGRYETDYLNRMRGRSGSKRLINRLLDGSVNVLRAMYGKVYFPTYSNGLNTTLSLIWAARVVCIVYIR